MAQQIMQDVNNTVDNPPTEEGPSPERLVYQNKFDTSPSSALYTLDMFAKDKFDIE